MVSDKMIFMLNAHANFQGDFVQRSYASRNRADSRCAGTPFAIAYGESAADQLKPLGYIKSAGAQKYPRKVLRSNTRVQAHNR